MHEYATKYAELLEQVVSKVRSLTIDRVAGWIRTGSLGILAAALAFTAVIFLLLAIFGALEIALTTAGALALVGAVLVVAGSYLWINRT